jgi:methionine-S-sulfoxide reductase
MIEKATFALGCFWHPDDYFSKLKGVIKVTAGYTGGDVKSPTYDQVCKDDTGHAEAVEIEFDSEVISYEELVRDFFQEHDSTQVDGQGSDIGKQYRSAIFYHSEKQRAIAERVRDEVQEVGGLNRPIATLIDPAQTFYKTEEYHQKYLQKQRGEFE